MFHLKRNFWVIIIVLLNTIFSIGCNNVSMTLDAGLPTEQVPIQFDMNANLKASDLNNEDAKQVRTGEILETAVIPPELTAYLENTFCQPSLCSGPDGWTIWIIMDDGDLWQLSELELIRSILIETIAALDDVGLDGYALLAGYRFRRINADFVSTEAEHRILANVEHENLEITLSHAAFLRQQGFPIYHELGHVVDYRLDRQLTTRYLAHSQEGAEITNHAIGEGYWVSFWGEAHINEGTADAFAIWVMLEYAGKKRPIFPRTPVTTDYEHIAQTISTILTDLSQLASN